jgi:hypothetical protein
MQRALQNKLAVAAASGTAAGRSPSRASYDRVSRAPWPPPRLSGLVHTFLGSQHSDAARGSTSPCAQLPHVQCDWLPAPSCYVHSDTHAACTPVHAFHASKSCGTAARPLHPSTTWHCHSLSCARLARKRHAPCCAAMRHPIDIGQHVKHDHTRPHEGHTKWQGTTAAARAWVRRSGSTPAAAQSCWRCSLGTSSRLHRHTRCELQRADQKARENQAMQGLTLRS